MKHKLESRSLGEISITSDTHITTSLKNEEELKSLLMKVKVESEKAGLKQHSKNKDHGIWSYHFMANRWENVETVSDCIFIGAKINVDGDCSYEIKRHLLLGRIAMTNLDSVLESRDIILLTKVLIVKAIVFPVVMYGCESWTIKMLSTKELMLSNCGAG